MMLRLLRMEEDASKPDAEKRVAETVEFLRAQGVDVHMDYDRDTDRYTVEPGDQSIGLGT